MRSFSSRSTSKVSLSQEVKTPLYLEETYWWAYLHPKGVQLFRQQWLVNAILWGNFAKLRDANIANVLPGRVLQVACVYGHFTEALAGALPKDSEVTVIDVAPIQLNNLSERVKDIPNILLCQQDSSKLNYPDASFDSVVLFFLLHEQPEEVRKQTILEAVRVTRSGGRIVITDYHKPSIWNPMRLVMYPVLKILEPFAMDLWRTELASYLPPSVSSVKTTSFGGLYQQVIVDKHK